MRLCGGMLSISSARHYQANEPSKAMDRVIENYIRCYCEHMQTGWNILLSAAKFVHDSGVIKDLGATYF